MNSPSVVGVVVYAFRQELPRVEAVLPVEAVDDVDVVVIVRVVATIVLLQPFAVDEVVVYVVPGAPVVVVEALTASIVAENQVVVYSRDHRLEAGFVLPVLHVRQKGLPVP